MQPHIRRMQRVKHRVAQLTFLKRLLRRQVERRLDRARGPLASRRRGWRAGFCRGEVEFVGHGVGRDGGGFRCVMPGRCGFGCGGLGLGSEGQAGVAVVLGGTRCLSLRRARDLRECCGVIGTRGPPLRDIPAHTRHRNDSLTLHTLLAPRSQPLPRSIIPILSFSTPLPPTPLHCLPLLIPCNRPKRRPELQPPRTRPPPHGW